LEDSREIGKKLYIAKIAKNWQEIISCQKQRKLAENWSLPEMLDIGTKCRTGKKLFTVNFHCKLKLK